jgi:putative nucleotidyltransferase with HDIG domain
VTENRAPRHPENLLLFVHDDVVEEVQAFLTQAGFPVDRAGSAGECLAAIGDKRFALALIDVSRGDVDAAGIVPAVLEADPDLAIVVLAGVAEATSAAICLQQGAFEYVSTPPEEEELRLAIDRALRRRGTAIQTQQISAWLKQELVERTRELERERRKLEQVNVATLAALINALEAKDPDFVGHSVRVAELAASVATELGLSDDDIEAVRAAGRLHDIGKIGIRDDVLRKRGPLTEDEQSHIRDQVLIGFRILAPLGHLGSVRQFVRSHHEHWDGTGYPDGLRGVEIPIGARIVFAAEIYDAITSPRPYQERLTRQAALAQMQQLAGTKLDPAVVEALASVVSRRKSLVFVRDFDTPQSDTVRRGLPPT